MAQGNGSDGVGADAAHAAASATTEILSRLKGRSVRCYFCGDWFRAAARAETASCSHCNKQVHVQDVHVRKSHWGSTLLSCGRITVHKRAKVHVQVVAACHGVSVHGRLDGHIVCGGPVELLKGAVVRGSISAPSLRVEPGAVLEGGFVRAPDSLIGSLDLPRGGVPAAAGSVAARIART